MLAFDFLLLASMSLIKFVERSTVHFYFMDTAQQSIPSLTRLKIHIKEAKLHISF